MKTKDLFSAIADHYAAYRPTYPKALVKHIASLTPYRGVVWDCATGNGQLALALAKYFNLVCASDMSEAQIKKAPAHSGIHYSVQPAHSTDYPEHFFDAVTVGQAIHWFANDAFYNEVKRVLKPGGLMVCVGYGLCNMPEPLNAWLQHFYTNVVGAFWEPERKIIDEHYSTLYFPFQPVPFPEFSMKHEWTLQQFAGYINTWSAVQNMKKELGETCLQPHLQEMEKIWGTAKKYTVDFPLLIKAGTV
jgi:ubiquinone/menaquinone biosynthesis C-methylase UbiE